ncbi:MAG: DUF1028 domain-containing protein [Planctomycetota bacterium]|nr:DUF1028 domain-containing protein [Planctomycetota bacterium]
MRLLLALSLLTAALSIVSGPTAPPPEAATPPVATFSIVAFDPKTGDLGVAVQSKFFGVGAVVPWAEADVGAIATQSYANTTFGPEGLALLDDGAEAKVALARLVEADQGRDRRQLGIVDAKGRAAAYTGSKCFAWAGHRVGEHYCCQGNILAGKGVVDAMAERFEALADRPLAERLVAALAAGQAAGGDKRGKQSAALLVVRRGGGYAAFNDRYIDLHVEDHETPIEELQRLLALFRRTMPPARVPEPVAKDLVREPREAEPARSTPRAAFEAAVRLGNARGTYLGTRRTETGAEVHAFVPGKRDVLVVTLRRAADGTWAIVD